MLAMLAFVKQKERRSHSEALGHVSWSLRCRPQIPENPADIRPEHHGYTAAEAPKCQRGSMRMHATGCFLLQDMGGGKTFLRLGLRAEGYQLMHLKDWKASGLVLPGQML